MRIYASTAGPGRIVDLDTGLSVPGVVWVDADAGELCACAFDGKGQKKRDADGSFLVYFAKGRFRFESGSSSFRMGAPKCARCPSTMTLPGDDLCPACRAADRGRQPFVRRVVPFTVGPCERCSRVAVWEVADEVTVTPQADGSRLFSRAAMVELRRYCDRCYEPPRLLDAKGEVVKEFDDVSSRPQW